MANNVCKSCADTCNLVNGLYCNPLQRYVEHAKEPPCIKNPKKQ